MAFTGSATIKEVSDGLVRITGLSLAFGASGTISLSGGTGDVKLPAAFQPGVYDTVSLQDSCKIDKVDVASATAAAPLVMVKTGTTPADFLITLTNASGSVTSTFELYVRFH